MTPFQEELYELIQECKNDASAFTTEAQDAGTDVQRSVMFSHKWDYKDRYEELAKNHEAMKRSFEKEKLVIASQATKNVIKELIPIIDECFMLMNFAEKGSQLEKGFKLILENMEQIFTRRGGGIIRPVIGEKADPTKHTFIEAEEVKDHIGTTVADVFRYGYFILGQIVREAEIKVKCGLKS